MNGEVEDYVVRFGVLPIELTYFEGQLEDCASRLMWATASESNNKQFVVEYSNDGLNFEAIGYVDGAGTTQTTNYYNFIDSYRVGGKKYYRLVQYDFNGNFTVSNVIILNSTCNEGEIHVYPNPVKDESLTVTFSLPKNDKITLSVFDVLGREVTTRQVEALAGYNEFKIDMPTAAAGNYILRLRDSNNQDKTIKFTKIK